MFLLKKIIGSAMSPLVFSLGLVLIGFLLLLVLRKKRYGRVLVVTGFLLIMSMSIWPVANFLLLPLEKQYHPLDVAQANKANIDIKKIKWIVVLAGGQIHDLNLPVASRLSEDSLVRMVEGIRLHRLLPDSKLLVSGGSGYSSVPEAETMRLFALEMGVEASSIVLEGESRDTAHQAVLIKNIMGESMSEPIILVTSASHMPRSMALFKKQGFNPIAAPAGFLVENIINKNFLHYLPAEKNLYKSHRAVHEYLGLAWGKIRRIL